MQRIFLKLHRGIFQSKPKIHIMKQTLMTIWYFNEGNSPSEIPGYGTSEQDARTEQLEYTLANKAHAMAAALPGEWEASRNRC